MVAIVVWLLTFPIIIINISHQPYSGISGYQSNTEKDKKGLRQCAKLQDYCNLSIFSSFQVIFYFNVMHLNYIIFSHFLCCSSFTLGHMKFGSPTFLAIFTIFHFVRFPFLLIFKFLSYSDTTTPPPNFIIFHLWN